MSHEAHEGLRKIKIEYTLAVTMDHKPLSHISCAVRADWQRHSRVSISKTLIKQNAGAAAHRNDARTGGALNGQEYRWQISCTPHRMRRGWLITMRRLPHCLRLAAINMYTRICTYVHINACVRYILLCFCVVGCAAIFSLLHEKRHCVWAGLARGRGWYGYN